MRFLLFCLEIDFVVSNMTYTSEPRIYEIQYVVMFLQNLNLSNPVWVRKTIHDGNAVPSWSCSYTQFYCSMKNS